MELFAGHPDRATDPPRAAWECVWRSGYQGGSERSPFPEDAQRRKRLSHQSSKCLHNPTIAAHLAELDANAASVFAASPEGVAVREHAAQVELGRLDAEELAAANLQIIASIAHHDPRRVMSWTQTSIEVLDSNDLEPHEAILVREVRHEDIYAKDGSTTHVTTVKLAGRAPYVKMLEQRVGKLAPLRVEHSGPGGGSISHEHELEPPTASVLVELARGLLGCVPASTVSDDSVQLEDVVTVLRRWAADDDPEVLEPELLFNKDAWQETRARYLVDDA